MWYLGLLVSVMYWPSFRPLHKEHQSKLILRNKSSKIHVQVYNYMFMGSHLQSFSNCIRVLYLFCISVSKVVWIELETKCQALSHSLASFRCVWYSVLLSLALYIYIGIWFRLLFAIYICCWVCVAAVEVRVIFIFE